MIRTGAGFSNPFGFPKLLRLFKNLRAAAFVRPWREPVVLDRVFTRAISHRSLFMSAFAAKPFIRIADPDPFGDVTLAPAAVTGRSESELARSMADALLSAAPASGAEALDMLRRLFPASPLTVRVAALDAIMRR